MHAGPAIDSREVPLAGPGCGGVDCRSCNPGAPGLFRRMADAMRGAVRPEVGGATTDHCRAAAEAEIDDAIDQLGWQVD